MEALFLFSDSPLSDYVLDKMETDASYRQAFMQKSIWWILMGIPMHLN
ncbi:hypothetical protein J4731_15570 [Providencia rettgeri]|nr:hypothetical protein [Providencia rettgeri]